MSWPTACNHRRNKADETLFLYSSSLQNSEAEDLRTYKSMRYPVLWPYAVEVVHQYPSLNFSVLVLYHVVIGVKIRITRISGRYFFARQRIYPCLLDTGLREFPRHIIFCFFALFFILDYSEQLISYRKTIRRFSFLQNDSHPYCQKNETSTRTE